MSSGLPRSGLDFSAAFQRAAWSQRQGRLAEAERLFDLLLKADPRHFESLYRLGVIRLQKSRFEDAERLFRRAIEIDGKSAEAQHYLAFALTGLNRLEDAVRHYDKAIATKPNVAEIHNNLGHALQRLGRFEAAIACYEKALAMRPDFVEARNNLGNTLHQLNRNEEAIAHYRQAIQIKSDYAEAHWNFGNALRTLGRFDEAILQYRKALAIRPNYIEIYNGLGNTLRLMGQRDQAIAEYKKALEISPTHLDALINLGGSITNLDEYEASISYFNKALAASPDNADVITTRGAVLAALKRYDEAIKDFETALAIAPDHVAAFEGLINSALAACDWPRTGKLSHKVATCVSQGKWIDPFTVLGYSGDPALQSRCAKTHIARVVVAPSPPLWQGTIWRNPKIRLAYVASGYHQHPTAYLSAQLIEIHDRSRFEVLGFSLGPDDDSEIRARLIRSFDQFHDVRMKSDREIAVLMNEMQIDIAVDRSGHTTNARPGIFALRPAPIQVNYLGFPGTLGADFYDYVIADPIVLPCDQQPFYSEKIVHLPDCYLSNDTTRTIPPDAQTRAEAGLPTQSFVFCCFNNNYKITAELFDIWMRLLHRVDGSVLWLLRENAAAERNLQNEAAARGIAPDRLVFADRLKHEQHLARHRLADLFLDTLPLNAHTTGSDALWAGLPLITCRGDAFAGRVGESLLKAVGLPELVTRNLQDYEALALRLATEPPLLRGFRERLRRNRLACPLFDSDRYRRHIEAAYVTMWQIWQRGESLRSFAVECEAHP
jgi:predicted O-linked N-acetylglucosamine transferase (SPINDLY family)